MYQVRVASVVDITGRRLQLSYDEGGDGFWCHEESPLIHPVGPCHASHVTSHTVVMDVAGWARRVGHQISAGQAYHDRCLTETFLTTDSTPDMFPEYRQPPGHFKAGQSA